MNGMFLEGDEMIKKLTFLQKLYFLKYYIISILIHISKTLTYAMSIFGTKMFSSPVMFIIDFPNILHF